MKLYFITGEAVFIGSALSERLVKERNKVVEIDNFCVFYTPRIKENNIKELEKNENFKLYRKDIRDRQAIKQIFDENEIDIVIHLIAMAGVRPSIRNPVLYQEVNCMGIQNILEEMKSHKVKNLVMVSSSRVYGNCTEVPFREDMVVDFAISPYAATQKANEVMTLAINKFTRLMLNNKEIPMYGDGSTSRDYTYVDNIVDGILKSCNYVKENKGVYEILNLGNSSPVSLRKMINTIADVVDVEVRIKQLTMRPGDVDRTFSDVSKAKKLIGYITLRHLLKRNTELCRMV